jgi:hypothetical protein
MIPRKGSSFGRAAGRVRRYSGGTENASIFATVRGSIPNRRAASRRLSPSTYTARAPARTVPRLSSLRPLPILAEDLLLPDFCSSATGLSGRITEGFFHRRSHCSLHPSW